ncbi:RAxF-45 family protein [Desulfosporosinus sp. FKB]|uniref:RAxF-45 family protein n=1 Tax=Desulfosporosinus sp. FKB TaxID=1969835 RepID=UPI001483808C|nr:RAxF-45 family protein [Desulfosporosinus sp. FKB]
MNRDFAMLRLEQLPIAIFGIMHAVSFNGIAMPIFRQLSMDQQNCEMTHLP